MKAVEVAAEAGLSTSNKPKIRLERLEVSKTSEKVYKYSLRNQKIKGLGRDLERRKTLAQMKMTMTGLSKLTMTKIKTTKTRKKRSMERQKAVRIISGSMTITVIKVTAAPDDSNISQPTVLMKRLRIRPVRIFAAAVMKVIEVETLKFKNNHIAKKRRIILRGSREG